MELCIRPQFNVGDKVWQNGLFGCGFDSEVQITDIEIDPKERKFIYKYIDPDFKVTYGFSDAQVGISFFRTRKELDIFNAQL